MMRSMISLAVLGAVARAAKYDNTAETASIAAGSTTLGGEGQYYFTNVATGETLSFVRRDITHFYPTSGRGDPLDVQFNSDGQARLSGANNKCVSAQWTTEGRGYDHAAVSYACKVGTGLLTGTETLEPTKQWWYILPAGAATDDSSDSSDASSDDAAADDDSSNKVADVDAKILLAKPKTSTNDVSQNDVKQDDVKDIPLPQRDPAAVVPADRSTWICRHDGPWLAARPGYTDTHPECVPVLHHWEQGTARRLKRQDAINSQRTGVSKRSASHSKMAMRLRARAAAKVAPKAKRGPQTYWIIPLDHILDQQTRAVTSSQKETWGGYISTVLDPWDKNDPNQLWTVTQA